MNDREYQRYRRESYVSRGREVDNHAAADAILAQIDAGEAADAVSFLVERGVPAGDALCKVAAAWPAWTDARYRAWRAALAGEPLEQLRKASEARRQRVRVLVASARDVCRKSATHVDPVESLRLAAAGSAYGRFE